MSLYHRSPGPEALAKSGPLIDLGVCLADRELSGLFARGASLPLVEPSVGVLDTGAAYTVIDKAIRKRLRLKATGKRVKVTVAGSKVVRLDTYMVSVFFPGMSIGACGSLEVVALDLQRGAQAETVAPLALVGRDLLAYFKFTYDGQRGTYALERAPAAGTVGPRGPEQS